MEIFKLKYEWYEGDCGEVYLGKDVNQAQFEKDLREAKEFAKSLLGKIVKQGEYLGKGYSVECLPEFYEQVAWFLTNKKGYIRCSLNDSEYSVEDFHEEKIIIERIDREVKKTKI